MWIHFGENFIDIWGGADFGPYSSQSFPTACGRWQNMNLFMYSKSRFLCVFWRIVKARKVDSALHNVFCIVTLSIVIYVDNICIRWETDQKCSPKTLIGSVIVSVLASSAVHRGFESRSGQIKDYQLVFVAYNAKHAELSRKSKDWLRHVYPRTVVSVR